LTDITGVLDKDKQLIESIPSNALQKYISDGIISGGMIPKLGF
jgi:acetylglutamate kinase